MTKSKGQGAVRTEVRDQKSEVKLKGSKEQRGWSKGQNTLRLALGAISQHVAWSTERDKKMDRTTRILADDFFVAPDGGVNVRNKFSHSEA